MALELKPLHYIIGGQASLLLVAKLVLMML